jgi:hypothetical protein
VAEKKRQMEPIGTKLVYLFVFVHRYVAWHAVDIKPSTHKKLKEGIISSLKIKSCGLLQQECLLL